MPAENLPTSGDPAAVTTEPDVALRALGVRLSQLLAEGDPGALEAAAGGAELLSSAFTPAEDQAFKAHLRRFDFDEAAEQLRTLLERHDCLPTLP